jgi:hypothetical protein
MVTRLVVGVVIGFALALVQPLRGQEVVSLMTPATIREAPDLQLMTRPRHDFLPLTSFSHAPDGGMVP